MKYINSFDSFINETNSEWDALVVDLKNMGWEYNSTTNVAYTTYVTEYGDRKIEISPDKDVIMWKIFDDQGNLLDTMKFDSDFLGEGVNLKKMIIMNFPKLKHTLSKI